MKRIGTGFTNHLLENTSLIYIFLPCFLFALGWLTPLIAIPCCFVLAFALYRAMKMLEAPPAVDESGPDPECAPESPLLTGLRLTAILGLVVLVVVFSGIGGYGHQVNDYAMKHNSFLRDFMEFPWPVAYASRGKSASGPLVTYFAFYLPSALVGKALGWNAANLFSVIWSCVGLYIAVLWFLRLVGKISIGYTLLFLFFGGLDLIGWLLTHKSFFPIDRHITLDFWLGHAAWQDPVLQAAGGDAQWYYFSNMTFLYQAVHHILPGTIIVLMCMYQATHRRSVENLALLWAAAPLGSVLVAIGMAPYVLVSMVAARCRNLWTFQNVVAGPVLLLISGLFFLSNNAQYPHGWLWQFQKASTAWIVLLLFYTIEFGAYVAVCPGRLTDPGTRPGRLWWWTAVACLMVFPLYRLGVYNDLAAKAALPSLLVFQVYLACTIRNARADHERSWARLLVFLLILGSCSALNEFSRGVGDILRPAPPPYESIRHVTELPDQEVARQLFGDENAFFWKYLAKPLEYH